MQKEYSKQKLVEFFNADKINLINSRISMNFPRHNKYKENCKINEKQKNHKSIQRKKDTNFHGATIRVWVNLSKKLLKVKDNGLTSSKGC